MADETRTPEEAANDFLAAYAAENGDKVWLRVSAGDELRDRLAALIRGERERAFYAGVESGRRFGTDVGRRVTAERRAARRLAVEGRSDG